MSKFNILEHLNGLTNYITDPPMMDLEEGLFDKLQYELEKNLKRQRGDVKALHSSPLIEEAREQWSLPRPEIYWDQMTTKCKAPKDRPWQESNVYTIPVKDEAQAVLKYMWGYGPGSDLSYRAKKDHLKWECFEFKLHDDSITFQISYFKTSDTTYAKELEEHALKMLRDSFSWLISRIEQHNAWLEERLQQLVERVISEMNQEIMLAQFDKHPNKTGKSWVERNTIVVYGSQPPPELIVFVNDCKVEYTGKMIQFHDNTNNWKLFRALVEAMPDGLTKDLGGVGRIFDRSKCDDINEYTKKVKQELAEFLKKHGEVGRKLNGHVKNQGGLIKLNICKKLVEVR